MHTTKIVIVLMCYMLTFSISPLLSQEYSNSVESDYKKAKTHIQASLNFLEQSNKAKLSQNEQSSQLYFHLSQIHLSTAQSLFRTSTIKSQTELLKEELASIQSKNFKIKEQFKDNISKLKEHKDKITLSEELLYNNSLNNLETALTQINAAEDVDATVYSSHLLTQAHNYYQKASENHEQGKYELSATESDKSIELAKRAFDESSNKFQAKQGLKDKFANIFGFSINSSDSSLVLLSTELFSPQSSSIRFDLYPSLDKIAGIIKNSDDIKLEIKAHNNSYKSRTKNKKLSAEQRDTIMTYLISKGITENAFIINDYPSKEITAERKVEIILIN